MLFETVRDLMLVCFADDVQGWIIVLVRRLWIRVSSIGSNYFELLR